MIDFEPYRQAFIPRPERPQEPPRPEPSTVRKALCSIGWHKWEYRGTYYRYLYRCECCPAEKGRVVWG